ncbi:MFS transporter [Mumia zhuanghuii]|uniref:NarK/NasA family nitrate transporter n=1 Tax=Mumia zhuanghuii TaxID=2585211 RepID=A0A5C4MLR8_9ACTN|nr:MFS transporter [Mumia zhuanghuii]TNC43612.1 NarK/NasA family nitrate transporter [Mumia zhuanghuii]TNC46674.1 NarK/NasA family nitrate transporter [Mumia zhuanghuii]
MTTATELPALPKAAQTRNLILATWAFAISFWAWNLIGPLAARYATQMDLSATQKSFVVAVPVIVGALGRIAAGTLTDKFGGRLMFTVLLVMSAPFVVLVAVAGNADSYPLLVVFGFFLGIAGTTFAVGIPMVKAWFEKPRQGFATGLFGAGMGGTALSSFFTPRFVEWFGYTVTHVIIAAALLITAALCWSLMRDSPRWTASNQPAAPKLLAALKEPVTWQMSLLYAIAFGGFVAFSTYLPTYLGDVLTYGYDLTDAGERTAGFAIAAVVARPVGGILSDKLGPRLVTLVSLAGIAVMAVVLSLRPEPEWPAGIAFVLMAMFLGLGSGSVFAWVAQRAPADKTGSVTGVVGAAGGLGGFFPPLVMGATYNEQDHTYTTGLLLLCAASALVFLYTAIGMRDRPAGQRRAT